MRQQIAEAVLDREIESAALGGCLCLFPYFAVIFVLCHLHFVYEHAGMLASALVSYFCILLFFCGGFLFNCAALFQLWQPQMPQNVEDKYFGPCVCVTSVWWIFLSSAILSLSMNDDSPLHQYWQLSASPLQGLSICSVNEWKESTRGLYFHDGAVSLHGSPFVPIQINVSECQRPNSKSPWTSCSFLVRPIVACDRNLSGVGVEPSCDPKICAWDVSREDRPDTWKNADGKTRSLEKLPTCHQPGMQLCGWVTSPQRMVPDFQVGQSGLKQFDEGLQQAAQHFQKTGPTNLPLLHLGDPMQEAKELAGYQSWFFSLVLLYVPATTLVLCILCCMDGGCERWMGNYVKICEDIGESDDDDWTWFRDWALHGLNDVICQLPCALPLTIHNIFGQALSLETFRNMYY